MNQNPIRKKTTALPLGLTMAGMLGMTAIPALANLLAYEGFKYTPAQTLEAGRGGSGWALNWSIDGSNKANGIIRAASLNGNASIATSGGAISMGNGAIYARALASTLGTPNTATTRWLSLFFLGGSPAGNESRIGLYSGMNDGKKDPEVIEGENTDGNTTTTSSGNGVAQVVNIGRTNAEATAEVPNDTICIYPTATSTAFVTTNVATPRETQAAFLLLRFNLGGNGNPDTLSLWVNPKPGAGEAALGPAQATWTTSDLDAINGFRLQAGGTGKFTVDEIRIGTTFADVTPAAPLQGGQITSIAVAPDTTLVWDSFGDGQNYTVQTSPNLAPGSWSPAGATITDGTLTTTLPTPAEPAAFFRVTSP